PRGRKAALAPPLRGALSPAGEGAEEGPAGSVVPSTLGALQGSLDAAALISSCRTAAPAAGALSPAFLEETPGFAGPAPRPTPGGRWGLSFPGGRRPAHAAPKPRSPRW